MRASHTTASAGRSATSFANGTAAHGSAAGGPPGSGSGRAKSQSRVETRIGFVADKQATLAHARGTYSFVDRAAYAREPASRPALLTSVGGALVRATPTVLLVVFLVVLLVRGRGRRRG